MPLIIFHTTPAGLCGIIPLSTAKESGGTIMSFWLLILVVFTLAVCAYVLGLWWLLDDMWKDE